ncbi:phage Gp37/Gp68 family protein [Ferrovibrio terrae]|uniref:phage Gp37/Gp68 family protein n=1 Tax=Ferrovibrio terrae TaxID=2594003 RepID=UPI003138097D
MAENSKIEWTDHTFNPWLGCTRVSPGCQHCYAETQATRVKLVEWGPKANRRRTGVDNWRGPVKWNAKAEKLGIRFKVFCSSMADVFDDHPSIRPEWRGELWALIRETPHLDWLLLTKRPENWAKFLPNRSPPPSLQHARLGVTIEDQPRFDERSPHIIREHGHGWPTFVSYEPALGAVDWRPAIHAIDWLICGGESGHGARPMHPDWARQTRDDCNDAGVPFFFKQWGEWARLPEGSAPEPFIDKGAAHFLPESGNWMARIGKHAAGRHLDGALHDAVPA